MRFGGPYVGRKDRPPGTSVGGSPSTGGGACVCARTPHGARRPTRVRPFRLLSANKHSDEIFVGERFVRMEGLYVSLRTNLPPETFV